MDSRERIYRLARHPECLGKIRESGRMGARRRFGLAPIADGRGEEGLS
ncbi:MAG: hypothetical protein JXL84_12540 [Deltaproteobacteria bacterium]|nr:hypothetical protein [Deltaproteobacteria bacterium]